MCMYKFYQPDNRLTLLIISIKKTESQLRDAIAVYISDSNRMRSDIETLFFHSNGWRMSVKIGNYFPNNVSALT